MTDYFAGPRHRAHRVHPASRAAHRWRADARHRQKGSARRASDRRGRAAADVRLPGPAGRNRIKPALAEGIWVVGTGTISPPRLTRVAGAALMPISSEPSTGGTPATSSRTPTSHLDIDPVIGLHAGPPPRRAGQIELEQLSFFERTRHRYLELGGRRFHQGDRRRPDAGPGQGGDRDRAGSLPRKRGAMHPWLIPTGMP